MAKTSMNNVVEDFSVMTDEKQEEYATLFCENDLELKTFS